MKAKRLTIQAMLAAMCAVLACFALNFGNLKFTFESLPVHVGALLLGPVSGMLIGGIGTLIYQLLNYGITATTCLWILPYVLCGLAVGGYAARKDYRLSRRQILLIVTAGELLITGMNTLALYIDSRLYGYYTPTLITGVLGLRLLISVVKAAAFGSILPKLLRTIRKVVDGSQQAGSRA